MNNMSYVIIHQQPDGSIALATMPERATLEDTLAEGARLEPVYGPLVAVKATSDITPMDRYFRPAWRFSSANGSLEYDIPACRIRHLEKLRRLRAPLLEKADFAIAIESDRGNIPRLNELRTYRQQLRDFPVDIAPALNAATTLEEIKAVRPPIFDQEI